MSDWKTANQGAELKTATIGAVRGVAAGTGDATEFTASGIDRLGFGSGKIVFFAHCNNTSGKKLQITSCKVAYAPDNGSGAPGSYGSDTETLTAAQDICVGTGDAYGSVSVDVDFTGKDRWLRVKFTPDSNASGTDVFEVGGGVVLGGVMDGNQQNQPVSNAAYSV